jgi:hypothetical protein
MVALPLRQGSFSELLCRGFIFGAPPPMLAVATFRWPTLEHLQLRSFLQICSTIPKHLPIVAAGEGGAVGAGHRSEASSRHPLYRGKRSRAVLEAASPLCSVQLCLIRYPSNCTSDCFMYGHLK